MSERELVGRVMSAINGYAPKRDALGRVRHKLQRTYPATFTLLRLTKP
jgi:hypothetical protein